MRLSESEGKTFLVTGGLGFVGAALCLELVRRGARHVRSLDVRGSSPWSSSLSDAGVVAILGHITRKTDVDEALRGADCVFHVASFGTFGKEMVQVGRIDEININGTCMILDACVELGVKRLVYVSTYNVVFAGKEIANGNEALPYLPLDDHVCPYAHGVSIAEQLVLKYNGHPLRENSGGRLYTCALRPAAIYGPGEDRLFPRIVKMAKLGLFLFKIGDATVKTDWVYVDNLVHALLMASMGLLDSIPGREGMPIAAGEPYFISDGSSVNTFEFIRPLLRSLDYDLPKATLSVPSALVFSKLFWVFYYYVFYQWLSKSWFPQPLILPAEVYQVGVTHYFSFVKAKEQLGYIPQVSPQEGMASKITYWQEKKRRSLDGPTIYAWMFCIIGLPTLFAVAFLPGVGPLSLLKSIALFIFRSQKGIRIAFYIVASVHSSEAIFAWHLARKVDPANSRGWFWQTLLLATFSLHYLLKRARSSNKM